MTLVAVACRSDVPTAPLGDDAARAVNVFTQLADSVARSGGDSSLVAAYGSLANAVRQGGRVSPIVISVDGVATTFLATAQQTEIGLTALGCPAGALCPVRFVALPMRSLVAWQQDDPRRVVQLSSTSDADPIAAYIYPTFAAFPYPVASLVFIDGKGGTFFGTSGSQKFSVALSDSACVATGPSGVTATNTYVPPRCTQATFAVSFSGKAEPSSFLARNNTASGSHAFAMAPQAIRGARFELPIVTTPLPPITVTPTASLPATLSAKVDSVVTLTLTVSNPSSATTDVIFGSGQQYDFTVGDANGSLLWRWSTGMAFTQVVSTRSVAANGSLVFTAQWKPTSRGTLIATGSLVSISHGASAKISLVVP